MVVVFVKYLVLLYIKKAMKKLLLLIGIVFLMSCEKEILHCYRCETIVNGEVISVITTCGVPESDIMNFEKALEIQASAMSKTLAKTKCILNDK